MATASEAPRWYVLGKGAVGCLWAAHLSRAGVPVTVLHRMRDTVVPRRGNIEVRPAWATTSSEALPSPWTVDVGFDAVNDEARGSPIDRLLVATKSFDAATAIVSVLHKLSPGVIIVLLVNGLGAAEEILAQPEVLRLAPHLVLATSTNGSYMTGVYSVAHAGLGQTWLGRSTNCSQSALRSTIESLCLANLGVKEDDDIELRLWRKLACNSALNPITALARCKNGATLSRTEMRRTITAVCTETAAVMGKCRCDEMRSSVGMAAEMLAFTVDVAERNAENYSSMYQDITNGRRTEVDFMNGYIISRGREHGVQVPTTELLFGLIKLLEDCVVQKGGSRL